MRLYKRKYNEPMNTSSPPISFSEALSILNTPDDQLDDLLARTDELTQSHVGKEVLLCGIVNAKSGECSEDCSFCSQSVHHNTEASVYPLLKKESLKAAQNKAKAEGVSCFSIVTAGRGAPEGDDFETILGALNSFDGTYTCTSMGIMTKEQLQQLKDAGMDKYHHNLETARSFFNKMCTTHQYEERVQTIRYAKEVGLQVCSGGIFGLGETLEQRVELALELRDLDVDSVPLNILHPIEGTKIYGTVTPIRPQDILKLLAMFRWVMPTKIIGLFGGRERNLQEWQPKMFAAGANSMLVGNYLTTTGNPVDLDWQLIEGAGRVPMRKA